MAACYWERFTGFLFPSRSDRSLSILRVGLGIQVVLYCLSLRKDWVELFAENNRGAISRELMEALLSLNARYVPRLGWLVDLGKQFGVGEETVLAISWLALLCAAICLLFGFCCRASAITTWFLYVCSIKSGNLFSYGVDTFTTIGLFYLMLAPFPDRLALDRRLWKSQLRDPEFYGFFQRVLQLHLCVIYFFGGLTKALGAGWWTGESLWRALTRPPFNIMPEHIIMSGRAVLPIAGIAVLVLEAGYPVFIWMKKTRRIWLIVIICMHIAIGLTMGLYLFTLIMITLNLAAFGPRHSLR